MRCLAKCFPLCVTPVVVPRRSQPNPLTFWQTPESAGKNKSKRLLETNIQNKLHRSVCSTFPGSQQLLHIIHGILSRLGIFRIL